jgi:hypothetical protein
MFNSRFLQMSGYTDEDLANRHLPNVSTEQTQDFIRKKSVAELSGFCTGEHHLSIIFLDDGIEIAAGE